MLAWLALETSEPRSRLEPRYRLEPKEKPSGQGSQAPQHHPRLAAQGGLAGWILALHAPETEASAPSLSLSPLLVIPAPAAQTQLCPFVEEGVLGLGGLSRNVQVCRGVFRTLS